MFNSFCGSPPIRRLCSRLVTTQPMAFNIFDYECCPGFGEKTALKNNSKVTFLQATILFLIFSTDQPQEFTKITNKNADQNGNEAGADENPVRN